MSIFTFKSKALIYLLDWVIILLFLLGCMYVLDDVVQVLAIRGSVEAISFHAFFFGPFVTVPLAITGWIKFRAVRFRLYFLISVLQILMIIGSIYIVMNSQV